ncbi:hypothetical protein [Peijinzhouia sedimentorum]
MIPQNKISKFLGLLIKDSKSGKVEWTISSSKRINSLEGEQNLIGKVYEAKYLEKYLRIYKYSEPVQVDEFEFQDKVFFKLEFVDDYENNLWSFPFFMRELSDLYNIVQIKSSGIDKFFDQFDNGEL